ncbi:sensor histidine kinase [Paenibacillus sp. FA6]|uniref:sensor histidine kinase n=1 Tax=Paenibacillus sp. FA6 TaxID=3413029 RepID=UPI003F65897A
MSYKQIKWLILFLPTLTVGLWEYLRHSFLLPYISMELGNILSPVFVYLISLTLLMPLFRMLEHNQEELNRERAEKTAFEARDHLARELHDGIAQSLFLLSVQLDTAHSKRTKAEDIEEIQEIRKTVHEVNRYARQAIANLRYPATIEDNMYEDTVKARIMQIAEETLTLQPVIEWTIPDSCLDTKHKIEMLACIREALLNITKHAKATTVSIRGEGSDQSWHVRIQDNGVGIKEDPGVHKDRYGMRIMKERAQELDWTVSLPEVSNGTIIEIRKEMTT